ncbi:hypothetical protein N4P55_06835 [Pseudomonas fluorescens]|uniref:hypothetical protein n=1 Tax=Pseudomonas fluorescens TaxID=294 RepID=UPI0021D05650|nr:hypothetical protein [Pseudomonas fluorescens]UXV21066.1 hypothetical protein N4P55_06835 [Pseudomonas fluorescens]
MTDFITVAQVDVLLGVDWTTEDKKPRAVLMANAWLTERVRPNLNPVPEAIVQAGAEVAREASQGKLYGAQAREVMTTSVKAGSVATTKSFAEGSKAITAGESFALALIKPWASSNQIKMVRG